MTRIMVIVDTVRIFLASCSMDSNGTARGNSATGPLIKIAQNILRPERIAYKQEKNIVGFFRLKRHSNTDRRIKKVMVFSSILFARAHEVIGITMNSMLGNQAPATAYPRGVKHRQIPARITRSSVPIPHPHHASTYLESPHRRYAHDCSQNPNGGCS